MKNKYIIYCHKYFENNNQQGNSIERQKQSLFAYAKEHELSVSRVFIDKNSNNLCSPIFREMIDYFQKGKANALLIDDLQVFVTPAAITLFTLLKPKFVKEIRTLHESYTWKKTKDFLYRCLHLADSRRVRCKACGCTYDKFSKTSR
ncbi:recombinase family protein [Candidatus Peregrinibacteria bacterium]|nr:recombinase family protein [Candidatus Peregrinibacteria bacterium]